MRPNQPTTFPTLLCIAIVLAVAAGLAVGGRLQDAGAASLGADARAAATSSGAYGFSLVSNAEAQAPTPQDSGPQTYRFADDHPKLTPVQPPDVAAPKFSRIFIEKTGLSKLEGDGTPGSQVLIKSEGIMIGAAVVDAQGHWAVALSQKLKAGDHAITSVAAGRETTQPGDEVRVYIPYDFEGREIVAYDRARQVQDAPTGGAASEPSTMQRAQDLAAAASKRFTEIIPPGAVAADALGNTGAISTPPARVTPPRTGIDVVTPVESWFTRASKAYRDEVAAKLEAPAGAVAPPAKTAQNMPAPPTNPVPARPAAQSVPEAIDPLSAGVAAVREWMKNANDTYDREIATPLSIPLSTDGKAEASGAAQATVTEKVGAAPVIKEPKPAVDTSGTAAEAAHKVQMEIIKKQAALRDAEARAEVQAKASAGAQDQVLEAKRRQAEEAAAKARDAERAAADQARKEAEAKKMVEGMKRLEAAQQAEEARKAKAAKIPAPPEELPSQRETKRERERDKVAAAEPDQVDQAEQSGEPGEPVEKASKPLEFTIEAAEDDADVRDTAKSSEPGRTKRSRQAQLDERHASSPSVKRSVSRSSEASSKATRVQSYRSRRDDARRARNCSARDRRPKGSSHMIYVVQPGDTLWAIANRHYRKGNRYNIIYRANQQRLPNADLLRPCQKLVLPGLGRK